MHKDYQYFPKETTQYKDAIVNYGLNDNILFFIYNSYLGKDLPT